jgi:hypothetical protein
LYGTYTFTRNAAILLFGIACAAGASLYASGVSAQDDAQTRRSDAQSNCTFSDGSTITFDQETWRTGEYEAIPFHISERMVIPPMDSPLVMPAGSYTLFVIDKNRPPWTLIVSKKAGQFGMRRAV